MFLLLLLVVFPLKLLLPTVLLLAAANATIADSGAAGLARYGGAESRPCGRTTLRNNSLRIAVLYRHDFRLIIVPSVFLFKVG